MPPPTAHFPPNKKVNVIRSEKLFYNCHKQGIDISDQTSSSFPLLRRTIRWYHEAAFEAVFGIAVTNAQNL
jgi:hypothetical protein